jgi:uncharacterized membrane protein
MRLAGRPCALLSTTPPHAALLREAHSIQHRGLAPLRRWSKQSAVIPEASVRKVRAFLHVQLAGVVLILLFAAMMARGVGFFG